MDGSSEFSTEPVSRQTGPTRSRRWLLFAPALLVCCLGTTAALTWWYRRAIETTPQKPAEFDEDLNVLITPLNPGYVGPQACAECHAKRVAEFASTRHFMACRPPDPALMPEGFAQVPSYYASRFRDIRFEMSHRGADFVETAVRRSAGGEERANAHIDLVYGAGGKADEVFHSWDGDTLYELPISWLHRQRCWAEEPFSPHVSGNFVRTTTARCLECHNTWFAHLAGTDSRFQRDSFILGVTCEKCHGPGREHVVFHQAHPGTAGAQAIVHPGTLSRERQMDVCAQCHSNTTKARGPANSYRPGEPLEAAFRMAQVKHREGDHVADQVKYLRQSKCFEKSDMTCITCHNPHKATDTTAVRSACDKCHRPEACTDRERQPSAVQNLCTKCHMPRFTRIQVEFHTATEHYLPAVRPAEHRIGVYPRARMEVLRHVNN